MAADWWRQSIVTNSQRRSSGCARIRRAVIIAAEEEISPKRSYPICLATAGEATSSIVGPPASSSFPPQRRTAPPWTCSRRRPAAGRPRRFPSPDRSRRPAAFAEPVAGRPRQLPTARPLPPAGGLFGSGGGATGRRRPRRQVPRFPDSAATKSPLEARPRRRGESCSRSAGRRPAGSLSECP